MKKTLAAVAAALTIAGAGLSAAPANAIASNSCSAWQSSGGHTAYVTCSGPQVNRFYFTVNCDYPWGSTKYTSPTVNGGQTAYISCPTGGVPYVGFPNMSTVRPYYW